ncbi:molybdopterin-dependent oxidoreductase [Falsirhodobacter sp. 20TX0035]|uniref:molybdopterin-dependent oxidoreductase n=1 Tax=Falsirhodobacter sp. 20TX0035 TaxID=3022019 RepID=UPI00232F68E5|nr:molybdopterin-dependent oxidoreductase [Falsirhodobacter sp. 20TX0035]MDB6452609.1 molybdopterin-dependent oxidoreductase [Falsirhodobacter sp. 20TX0035]
MIVATLMAALAAGPVKAEELPAAQGDVLLTISGKIANTNSGKNATFDRQMLEGLGLVDVTTTTPWHGADRMRFTGVPLSVLLHYVGAEGTTVTALALDDYQSEFPVSDTEEIDVLLAMKLNGEDMTVRTRGPLFIIYPYDSSSTLNTKTYYARSAWQVARLIIR